MAGTPTYVYTTDPGLEVLLANGPAINVVRDLQQAVRFAGGRAIIGVVGAVVDDRGRVNEAFRAPLGPEDITTQHGGLAFWLGDGMTIAARGAASGYNGNLAAQIKDMIAPVWVFCFPDLGLKTASISASGVDLLVEITRVATAPFVLPGGTRIDDGAGFEVATIERLAFADGELVKSVRVRQTSAVVADGGAAVVAMNTITTFVDTTYVAAQTLTVSTAAITVPVETDATEVVLRYRAALDSMTATLAGAAASIIVSDRTDLLVCDPLSQHGVAETAIGNFRVGVVSPPLGTSAAVAAAALTDGVGRATLDGTRTVYAYPGWRRSLVEDSANLVGPTYLATFPSAMLAACKIALEVPEQNPAIPHELFGRVGFAGLEAIVPAPVPSVMWAAGIMQPIIDNDEIGNQIGSFYAGIVKNGAEIANVRFDDYIVRGCIIRAKPWHKRAATEENQGELITSVTGFLEQLFKAGRIVAYGLLLTYDPTNEHAELNVAVQTNGNMNVITFRTAIGPGVVVA